MESRRNGPQLSLRHDDDDYPRAVICLLIIFNLSGLRKKSVMNHCLLIKLINLINCSFAVKFVSRVMC